MSTIRHYIVWHMSTTLVRKLTSSNISIIVALALPHQGGYRIFRANSLRHGQASLCKGLRRDFHQMLPRPKVTWIEPEKIWGVWKHSTDRRLIKMTSFYTNNQQKQTMCSLAQQQSMWDQTKHTPALLLGYLLHPSTVCITSWSSTIMNRMQS